MIARCSTLTPCDRPCGTNVGLRNNDTKEGVGFLRTEEIAHKCIRIGPTPGLPPHSPYSFFHWVQGTAASTDHGRGLALGKGLLPSFTPGVGHIRQDSVSRAAPIYNLPENDGHYAFSGLAVDGIHSDNSARSWGKRLTCLDITLLLLMILVTIIW